MLPEPPPARVAIYSCGSAAPRGHSAARNDVALRLRTRSIARSHARTIVTCTKSAPPRTLAPQTSAPKNKEAVLGRLCFWSSPTQVPTAEGPENKEGGTPPDYVFRGPRPPAPPSLPLYSTVLRGGGTWVGLPSARRLGGYCVVAQAHLWLMRHLQTVQAVYHCLYPSISIGRVFDTAYRDACTIGTALISSVDRAYRKSNLVRRRRNGSVEPYSHYSHFRVPCAIAEGKGARRLPRAQSSAALALRHCGAA